MIDPVELRSELCKSLEAGRMTEQFAFLAMEVAQGYFSARVSGDLTPTQRSDMLSDFCARLVNTWKGMDPDCNLHSCLTGKARSVKSTRLRSEKRLKARLADYQVALPGLGLGANRGERFDYGNEEDNEEEGAAVELFAEGGERGVSVDLRGDEFAQDCPQGRDADEVHVVQMVGGEA